VSLLFPRLAFADDAIAYRFGPGPEPATLSFRELARRAGAHAKDCAARGLEPGARVAVWATPDPATIVALVGQALAGLVSVPLNPKLGAKELAHILGDAQPEAVFAADPSAFAERAAAEPIGEGTASPPERDVDDRPLLVLYTSGTTGAPKGAVITARNVAANLDGLADRWGWTDRDEVVHGLPLFHVHGLVLGLFGSLRVGGALHHLGRFDAAAACEALAKEGTMLFAVPTMLHRLADAAEDDVTLLPGLRSARLLVSGSAGLPLREHKRLEKLSGRGVHERYGLTETLICCGVSASGDPQPGYVGPPLPGVELKLVDDARRTLDTHDDETLGEVAVRGPSVFAGYLNRPEATAAVRDDEGWFYTGDLAARREDGALRIVGRRSVDLIKTGGYKVGAGEVEACLLEDPGVAEVAVVGEPDDDLGQRIVAYVVPRGEKPEAEALIQRVADELTPHKRPREVFFVEALPRNAMGKVQKKRLTRSER